MIGNSARVALAASAILVSAALAGPAQARGTLRIAMTASDVPTTTGAPDNGFEGLRFFGYPELAQQLQSDLAGVRAMLEPKR